MDLAPPQACPHTIPQTISQTIKKDPVAREYCETILHNEIHYVKPIV